MGRSTYAFAFLMALLLASFPSCHTPPPPPVDPRDALIEKGRDIFFTETFNGNGRTCGTCHPAENNFTLDATFIGSLPRDNPLFVAEFNPALKENFENPRLMREFGLILENLDGFDDLANEFVMRGIPHTVSLSTSVASPKGPRTGWSGDGSPGDGSLRSFATGAVIQHFTKTLNRIPGVDFRLPTDDELDALEAFQLSLGRQSELTLPLRLKGTIARRGQELFMDSTVGKCNLCHVNAGPTALFGGNSLGNANFNTGVEALPDQPARLTPENVPTDDGFGRPGDSTFNVPPLVEAASTGPFFHNNAIETIEGAVAFYDGESFNNSPAGRFLRNIDPEGAGIELDGTQIVEIAAFLRVLNALESVRLATDALKASISDKVRTKEQAKELLRTAVSQLQTGVRVLSEGRLHPNAVQSLLKATQIVLAALEHGHDKDLIKKALDEANQARSDMIEP
ncbi:MAG: hypothetical protein AB1428_06880 [Bacteroidota bacterium]